MSVSINGTTGLSLGAGSITFADSTTQSTAASGFGFKNRIINGAMMIDQRNAGASVTPASGQYLVDRWFVNATQASKFTAQQNAGSVTTPAGFTKYLGITSSSAYAIGSGDIFVLGQVVEGFNIADLGWGTANAAAVTLSFKVYSSLTGTFGGCFSNGGTRSYPFTYTVSSANTWTTVTVNVAGDTSGTWATDNSAGIFVYFGLGVGSTYSGTAGSWSGNNYRSATGTVSVVGTNGATFYITGVQLEKGSTATSFDYRPYGTELALCQRYYEVGSDTNAAFWSGNTTSGQVYYVSVRFCVTKRASVTAVLGAMSNSGFPNSASIGASSTDYFRIDCSSNATGSGNYFRAPWTASAEL